MELSDYVIISYINNDFCMNGKPSVPKIDCVIKSRLKHLQTATEIV